jgi:AhpD family alkylhydroperoxidase
MTSLERRVGSRALVHAMQFFARERRAAMTTRNEAFTEIKETLGLVPLWLQEVPDASLSPLWTMMRDFYLAETTIPNKYKELIGLAVSGATRCRYCALFHTEAARVHGATDDEIAEASMMGAVTMLASTFLNAQQADYERFKKETNDIVKFVKDQRRRADGGARQSKPIHA